MLLKTKQKRDFFFKIKGEWKTIGSFWSGARNIIREAQVSRCREGIYRLESSTGFQSRVQSTSILETINLVLVPVYTPLDPVAFTESPLRYSRLFFFFFFLMEHLWRALFYSRSTPRSRGMRGGEKEWSNFNLDATLATR